MIKLSKSYFVSLATLLLVLLALAKLITLGVMWFLPSDGVDLNTPKNYKPIYQRVDFENMLLIAQPKQIKKVETKSSISITNMLLKGLYGKGNKGFAIVALKASANKTSIVSVGEVFSGYTLKEILVNGVVFEKDTKDYILLMENEKNTKNTASFIMPVETVSENSLKRVSKKDIKDYGSNPQKIWNDIGFMEVKRDSKVYGFKVTRVKANSEIGKLGLLKDDIVIMLNNIEMNSYKHALKLYENIDNIETIQIIVMRNNQEKELVYDIN